jgi:hypothetical protein
MTQAQKLAKAKFKQAIAYRTKTGVSLKEAFAHIYGKKKVVKKAIKKVARKKAVKKVAKKRIAGPKDSAIVKRELAKKGLKMPHGYATIKRKRKISGVKKKKITETGILNRIHKVKKDVERLDEAQHKHMIGKKIKIGLLPTYKDKDAAIEIQLYADSDYMLYQQRKRPILINLGKKYKKGTYDINKAAKLWRYYIDAAMQKYHKEHGSRGDKWYELLSVPDRNLLSLDYAMETKNEFDLGNFTI